MSKCSRCKTPFQIKHPLESICPTCLEKNPKLTPAEKSRANIWDNIMDFWPTIQLAMEPGFKWSWARNMQCKYIDVRIDMRDGGCIVSAKGERISPERLAWQYSPETPDPPT